MKYPQAYDGDLIRPRHSGYFMACCDCLLVHRIVFRVVGGKKIQFRVYRDNRKTAALRRATKS
jgi:hypothetical protein